jgi:cytochrome oxidase assembly protein ShyY1
MKSKKVLSLLLVFILAGITTELGIWQLHRAREEKSLSHPVSDNHLYQLAQVATAGSNLTSSALNKMVTIHGHYIKTYSAPGQSFDPSKNLTTEDTSGQVVSRPVTLDVRLLQLDGTTDSILVVRGVKNSDSALQFESCKPAINQVVATGRIYPRQTSDVALTSQSESDHIISRLDPAVVVADAPGKIYDGYIVENSEKVGSCDGSALTAINMKRLPIPLIISSTAGFYWQHIAYVVIWWFFTLLILTVPFYNQLRNRFAIVENLASLANNSGRNVHE